MRQNKKGKISSCSNTQMVFTKMAGFINLEDEKNFKEFYQTKFFFER